MDSPAARLRWARENRTSFKTASEAARAFGWPISTYLGHENGDRIPSRESAKRYARAYRVRWDWILEGGTLPEDEITLPRTMPIIGEVAAGIWEGMEAGGENFGHAPFVLDTRYPTLGQCGKIVRGTSINLIAQPGDILHCLLFPNYVDDVKDPLHIDVESGDLVIVYRRRKEQGLVETSAKRVIRHGRVIDLKPESTENHWPAFTIDEQNLASDETITISGLVLAVYRPLRSESGRRLRIMR